MSDYRRCAAYDAEIIGPAVPDAFLCLFRLVSQRVVAGVYII